MDGEDERLGGQIYLKERRNGVDGDWNGGGSHKGDKNSHRAFRLCGYSAKRLLFCRQKPPYRRTAENRCNAGDAYNPSAKIWKDFGDEHAGRVYCPWDVMNYVQNLMLDQSAQSDQRLPKRICLQSKTVRQSCVKNSQCRGYVHFKKVLKHGFMKHRQEGIAGSFSQPYGKKTRKS